MFTDIDHFSEKKNCRKIVHSLLSDPSNVWQTKSGKRIQVLSPGKINPFEGTGLFGYCHSF